MELMLAIRHHPYHLPFVLTQTNRANIVSSLRSRVRELGVRIDRCRIEPHHLPTAAAAGAASLQVVDDDTLEPRGTRG